jgi:hypothetical protein
VIRALGDELLIRLDRGAAQCTTGTEAA